MENDLLVFVSAIVPVFNDSQRLLLCLEALENQTYPKNFYEVIVIDNGSDDSEAIANVVARFKQAKLVCETFPSSYAARNKGISLAKGEVIAFTDADCIPKNNWIEQGVKHLLSIPNCGLVAGKIELFSKDPHRLTPVELYELTKGFPQQKFIEEDHYGATANVFTFKDAIARVGCFDSLLKSNGDFEWGQRIYLAGYQQIYADDVCVAHPARSSFKELYKRNRRLAGGIYDVYLKKKLSRWDFFKLLIRSLLEDLIDPFLFTIKIMNDSKIERINEKISISSIRFFIMYVRLLEKIRLQIGGVSIRE